MSGPRFEKGQFIGATWGAFHGKVERVRFVCNPDKPDGYLPVSSMKLGPGNEMTIYSPIKVPVKVEVIIYKGGYPYPPLDAIPALWEDFVPSEDYLPPLP